MLGRFRLHRRRVIGRGLVRSPHGPQRQIAPPLSDAPNPRPSADHRHKKTPALAKRLLGKVPGLGWLGV
jgi:hypothetical protein